MVWSRGEAQPVGLVAALLPQTAWVVLSAGEGSKGPRLYEWVWLQLPEETEVPSEHARWVLIRRSLSDQSERAYDRAYGPAHRGPFSTATSPLECWGIPHHFTDPIPDLE